jgi:hypothetical protein
MAGFSRLHLLNSNWLTLVSYKVCPKVRSSSWISSSILNRFFRNISAGPLAVPYRAKSSTVQSDILYVVGDSRCTSTSKSHPGPGACPSHRCLRNLLTASAIASYRASASKFTECASELSALALNYHRPGVAPVLIRIPTAMHSAEA